MTIYVLTREINAYDQEGEYFVHAWDHHPTERELKSFVGEVWVNGQMISATQRVQRGRINTEYEWFNLVTCP
jgi:hypothetical protein